ncbi:Transporter, drug/metabolite exporter family (plasmid) [Mycetohabitans rhizoxinica HKI 454]|uniref:Transporter, drug/metabolite exporter family n=1 Tax=Mycetohabitans rhizoxinica (strain DSM 19002 / CIP 109453 / HKI 454) TaxID=882378 RepID=E5AVS3_MYCRK|nr:Transporter, drug/metabolite exporter family [Mycetohabitans rhizoxinica HKI 454]
MVSAWVAHVRWFDRGESGKPLLAGALLQGFYLSAGYWAVAQGLGFAVMALLGALQPLLAAVMALIAVVWRAALVARLGRPVGGFGGCGARSAA